METLKAAGVAAARLEMVVEAAVDAMRLGDQRTTESVVRSLVTGAQTALARDPSLTDDERIDLIEPIVVAAVIAVGEVDDPSAGAVQSGAISERGQLVVVIAETSVALLDDSGISTDSVPAAAARAIDAVARSLRSAHITAGEFPQIIGDIAVRSIAALAASGIGDEQLLRSIEAILDAATRAIDDAKIPGIDPVRDVGAIVSGTVARAIATVVEQGLFDGDGTRPSDAVRSAVEAAIASLVWIPDVAADGGATVVAAIRDISVAAALTVGSADPDALGPDGLPGAIGAIAAGAFAAIDSLRPVFGDAVESYEEAVRAVVVGVAEGTGRSGADPADFEALLSQEVTAAAAGAPTIAEELETVAGYVPLAIAAGDAAAGNPPPNLRIRVVTNDGNEQTVAGGAVVTVDSATVVALTAIDLDAAADPPSFTWHADYGPQPMVPFAGAEDAAAFSNRIESPVTGRSDIWVIPPRPGRYGLTLTSDDGTTQSSMFIEIHAEAVGDVGSPPSAVAVVRVDDRETAIVPLPATGPAVATLDARDSSDPDGDTLTMWWSVATRPSGAIAEIQHPNEAVTDISFDSTGVYVLLLSVDDGTFVEEELIAVNVARPPVAEAGADQTADIGEPVILDGRESRDADGEPVELYEWRTVAAPAGFDDATLDALGSGRVAFTSAIPGRWTFGLAVFAGGLWSTEDEVEVLVVPVADAGADRVTAPGTVELIGERSSSTIDGFDLEYAWTVTAQPGGSDISDTDIAPALGDAANATVVLTAAGGYEFGLTVTAVGSDGSRFSAVDSVAVTVVESAAELPVADAGSDRAAIVGAAVEVDGSGSGPDDPTLGFRWRFVDVPSESDLAAIAIGDPTGEVTSFVPDVPGTYVLRLTVTSDGGSASDTVEIEAYDADGPDVGPFGGIDWDGYLLLYDGEDLGIAGRYHTEFVASDRIDAVATQLVNGGSLEPTSVVRIEMCDQSEGPFVADGRYGSNAPSCPLGSVMIVGGLERSHDGTATAGEAAALETRAEFVDRTGIVPDVYYRIEAVTVDVETDGAGARYSWNLELDSGVIVSGSIAGAATTIINRIGDLSIEIDFADPVQPDIGFTGLVVLDQAAATTTMVVGLAQSFAVQHWYVDGALIGSDATVTIDALDFRPGHHELTVFVQQGVDQPPYSASIPFTIIAGDDR